MTKTEQRQALVITKIEEELSKTTIERNELKKKLDTSNKACLNMLRNQERLLQSLINDGLSLSVYRNQILIDTRKDIKILEKLNEYSLAT